MIHKKQPLRAAGTCRQRVRMRPGSVIGNCVAVSAAQLTVSVGASENMDSNAVTVTLAFSGCPMVLKFLSHGGLTWSFML